MDEKKRWSSGESGNYCFTWIQMLHNFFLQWMKWPFEKQCSVFRHVLLVLYYLSAWGSETRNSLVWQLSKTEEIRGNHTFSWHLLYKMQTFQVKDFPRQSHIYHTYSLTSITFDLTYISQAIKIWCCLHII